MMNGVNYLHSCILLTDRSHAPEGFAASGTSHGEPILRQFSHELLAILLIFQPSSHPAIQLPIATDMATLQTDVEEWSPILLKRGVLGGTV